MAKIGQLNFWRQKFPGLEQSICLRAQIYSNHYVYQHDMNTDLFACAMNQHCVPKHNKKKQTKPVKKMCVKYNIVFPTCLLVAVR